VKLSNQLAELAGAFAADGSMQQKHLCFWGNLTEDKPYYDTILKNLFLDEFKIVTRPHPKPSNSVYGFYVCKPEILRVFNKVLNFPIGSKTYTVQVPKSILNDVQLYAHFIRGFADGDGCVHFSKRKGTASLFKRSRHAYPRIFLSSVSFQLLRQIQNMLMALEIKSTLLTKKLSRKQKVPINVITIRGKARLAQWMQKIGFNNAVHQTKIMIWSRFGFCPPYTTLAERNAILANKLDPASYYN